MVSPVLFNLYTNRLNGGLFKGFLSTEAGTAKMFSGVYLNRDTSKLMIAERLEDGSRRIMETPLVLEYYVPDARGKYVGIDGVVLRKIAVKNLRQFYQVKKEEAAKKKEDPNYRT